MMKLDQAYSGNVFICSSEDYENSKAVIYGMPMDYTVSFRPGSRFGPAHIRQASVGLEEYSPYLDKSIVDMTYFDAETYFCRSVTQDAALKSSMSTLEVCWLMTNSRSVLAASIW